MSTFLGPCSRGRQNGGLGWLPRFNAFVVPKVRPRNKREVDSRLQTSKQSSSPTVRLVPRSHHPPVPLGRATELNRQLNFPSPTGVGSSSLALSFGRRHGHPRGSYGGREGHSVQRCTRSTAPTAGVVRAECPRSCPTGTQDEGAPIETFGGLHLFTSHQQPQ